MRLATQNGVQKPSGVHSNELQARIYYARSFHYRGTEARNRASCSWYSFSVETGPLWLPPGHITNSDGASIPVLLVVM